MNTTSTEVKTPVWELADALPLLGTMNKARTKIGWFFALGGSVLYKGFSHKDLDVVCIPMNGGNYSPAKLFDFLEDDMGFDLILDAEMQRQNWDRYNGNVDTKNVLVYSLGGKRIDIIIPVSLAEPMPLVGGIPA